MRRIAGTTLAALLLAAAPAAAATRLTLRSARCVPAPACTPSAPRDVAPGGKLALTGSGLRRGMLVAFQRSSGKSITSKLRRSQFGFIVTVPPTARSGRIRVVDRRRRSNTFGPIRVVKRQPTAPAPEPSGTSFDGNGMWIWYVSKSEGGDLDAIAARAHAAGISTVFVKSGDGVSYWSQFSPLLVGGLKQRGLKVCAWQFVYGKVPEDEAAVAAKAVQTGAQCFVIDAETSYEGRYASAQTYIERLRSAVAPGYPLALTSFPYVDYHPGLPYSVFLGPDGAAFNLPQVYWKDIGTSVDTAMQHTYVHNRIYGRSIFPLGQSYDNPPPADLQRFRQLSASYGSSGMSWWSWQATSDRGWEAIGKELAPLADFTPSQDLPLLAKGAKGDEVLWMQEHLATADATTPTSGVFDAKTDTAMRNFQTQRAFPVTGKTDAQTWQALLALSPVPVDWTSKGPAFAAGRRRAGHRVAQAPRSARLPARKREIPVLGRH